MKRAAIATLTILVGGCTPTIGQHPPAASVIPPAAWRTELPGQGPIEPGWWQKFGDPVLTALVERALSRNSDIAIAAGRVREARAQETLARAPLLPSLDFGLGAVRQREIGPLGAPVTTTAAQPVFQAAYEVDLFGRIGDQVEAARQGAMASQAARDAAALSVAAATASGYITLRALDSRLAIVRETLVSREEALRIARNRARVGYTSDLELRQAQAEYYAAAQIVPQVELAIRRQEDALSVLVGEPPRAIERGLALGAIELPPVPGELPSELLRRRPDVAQAEYVLAASDASLAAARAQFLPRLNLNATLGSVVAVGLGDPVGIWSLGGSVLAPIFNNGRNQGQFDVALARRDQAAFAYQKAALTAFREVEDNLAAVQRFSEQQVSIQRQRDALASALGHARNRYEAGYTSYLEQLDAQRALLNAELALTQARADKLTATVALYQSLGGGWASGPHPE
ncbi:efflux transporter outer membrane subunit [Novosphingobium tardum]|uniref:Efflux transporter outer membrane subunit n=1 Tax=Novosphingobium tardum TaxID=1538021 RepID=A0ABV8RJE7_9SPHN